MQIITSSRERTKETAESFITGINSFHSLSGLTSIKQINWDLIPDLAFDPPSTGTFQGLNKDQIYIEYATKYLEANPNSKGKYENDPIKLRDLGKKLFRQMHLRQMDPLGKSIKGLELDKRRFAETMEQVADRQLNALVNHLKEQKG